jgi:hypothetical protein
MSKLSGMHDIENISGAKRRADCRDASSEIKRQDYMAQYIIYFVFYMILVVLYPFL